MKRFTLILQLLAAFIFANPVFAQIVDNKTIPPDSAAKYAGAQKRIDSLTIALQQQNNPKARADLFAERAIAETTLQHVDNAIDDCTKSIALNPDLNRPYVYRGINYEDERNYPDALKDYEKAVFLSKAGDSRLGYLYGRIGLIQWILKHYPEALSADSLADQLNHGDSFARANMGWVHFATQNYDLAITDFTRSMPGYQNDPSTLSIIVSGRANAERNLKRYKEAINDYLYALELLPDNKSAQWNLGLSYRLAGDYGNAEAAYDKTIGFFAADDKSLAKLYDEKAMLEIEEGKYLAAEKDDSIAISHNNNFGRAYVTMATAYLQNAEFQTAIKTYSRALDHYRDDKAETSSVYDGIAHAYYFLRNFYKCVEASNSALALNNGSLVTYFNRGKSFLKLNNKDRAISDFNKVMALDTGRRSYEYAFALFYTGKPDEAIKSIQKSITDTTSKYLMQTHYYNTACLYALMNKPGEANNFLKRCIDAGFSKKYALSDPDLDNIKDTPEFKDIMKQIN